MKSNLQVISGKYRGRKLNIPADARPTQNRARIAIFNMLESLDTKPAFVWDVFAGSGAFGIECISRYNSQVLFTDLSPDSIKTIKRNLVDISGKFYVIQTNAIDQIKRYGADIDMAVIDAPYSKSELADQFIKKISDVAKSGLILVWEIEDSVTDFVVPDGWISLRDKKYGRARFIILKKS